MKKFLSLLSIACLCGWLVGCAAEETPVESTPVTPTTPGTESMMTPPPEGTTTPESTTTPEEGTTTPEEGTTTPEDSSGTDSSADSSADGANP
jgi:hypothetical protein